MKIMKIGIDNKILNDFNIGKSKQNENLDSIKTLQEIRKTYNILSKSIGKTQAINKLNKYIENTNINDQYSKKQEEPIIKNKDSEYY